MTLVVCEESGRLVAPVELLPMPPAFISAGALLDAVLPEAPSAPGFLIRARSLAESHPDSGVAHVRLAQAELASGESDRAIEAARRAAKLLERSDDESAAMATAQVLIWAGAADRAAEVIGQHPSSALMRTLAARIAILAERFEVADALLSDSETRDALATRGWVLLRLRRFDQAINTLRSALRKGTSSGVLTNLGYAYAALGARAKAIKVTKEARALDPTSQLVSFNLISFFVAEGNYADAIREVRRLQSHWPNDLRTIFAEAEILASSGELDKAHRLLRRARTSTPWVSASLIERSELEANLAIVEWQLRRKTRSEARRAVVEALERSEYRAVDISWMLAALMNKTTDYKELERLTERLSEANPQERFDRLQVQQAFLRCDFDAATRVAVEWSKAELFNPTPASIAVYLLADVEGEYEAAVKLGEEVLKRVPSASQLRNNVAYALAVSGRLREARDLLSGSTSDGDVYLVATSALVDVLSGQIARGMAGYKRAYELARDNQDERLADLVELNRALALWRVHGRVDAHKIEIKLPHDWRVDPHMVMLERVAEREGVPIAEETTAEEK